MSRNKVLGGIGVLWGGGILVRGLFFAPASANSAYATGQTVGLAFGVIMLIAGIYYIKNG